MKKSLLMLILAITIFSCGENPTAPIITEPTEINTVALLTDFVSNSMLSVNFNDSSLVLTDAGINISNDPIGFKNKDITYILSRSLTSASILKIENGSVLLEKALPKSNPHDLSFKDSSFYATMYNDGMIYEINSSDLSIIDSIIIPTPADTSNPAPSGSIIVDGKLFVAQQFQKNWAPTRNGQVLIIDTKTNSIVDSINLPLVNPVSDFVASNDNKTLYISCVGSFSDGTDGGIVKIDIATKTTSVLTGILADPTGVLDIDEDDNLYFTAGFYGSYILNRYSAGVETKLNSLNTKGVTAIKVVDENIFVGYSSDNPELSVLDLSGKELSTDTTLTLPVCSFVK